MVGNSGSAIARDTTTPGPTISHAGSFRTKDGFDLMTLLSKAFVVLMLACTGCVNSDTYTEYFPARDGDKPDAFEMAFVKVCELEERPLSQLLSDVERFAASRHLLPHTIELPAERVVAVHIRGAPMRIHLMVERLGQPRYRVGVSSLHGFGCDDVCSAAEAYSFCDLKPSPDILDRRTAPQTV